MIPICILLFLVLIALSSYFFHKRKLQMKLLEKCGIPGPTPNFFTGNLTQYISMGNLAFHSWLINNYGPIVGYYLGAQPYILVSDPTLLQKIQVTDAKNFLKRPRRIPNGINPDPRRKNMLGHLEVDKWKKMRKVLSPSFSSAKLHPILPQIQELVQKLMDKIQITTTATPMTSEIEIGHLFQRFALDIIGATAFGQNYGLLNNPEQNHPLLTAVQAKFQIPNAFDTPSVKWSVCFPEIIIFLQPIRVAWQVLKDILGFGGSFVWTTAWDAIRQRQRVGRPSHNHTDELQVLLDGKIELEQIAAYGVHALQGGYETLSSMLCFITHLLAKHPDVQTQVREECQRSDDLTYESLSKLKYVDALIAEALRLWPQTTFIRRTPDKDYEFIDEDGNVCILPANVHIQIAHYQIHTSENNYENPSQFNLERFYGKNKIPLDDPKFQGFGCGYRHCMGYNLALLILKSTVVELLRKYKLFECDENLSRVDDHFNQLGVSTVDPTKPVYIRVESI